MPLSRPDLIRLLACIDQYLAEDRDELEVLPPESEGYERTLIRLTELEGARDRAEELLRGVG